MPMLDLRVLLLGVAAALAMGSLAWAEKDHDRARRAFQGGEIRSLSEILAELKPELGGEVIEVELERRRGGGYRYKFKILPSSGRMWEVHVDAATGRIIKREPD
jgi:uncharacterized membrane protein YkoI